MYTNWHGVGDTSTASCAALPSGTAAARLVAGDASAILPVLGYTIARAFLVGAGLALAGEREHLVKYSIAGALGIEVFVLAWAAVRR